nr:NADH dehydrogenase subunit 6 [Wallacea dactyliferae]
MTLLIISMMMVSIVFMTLKHPISMIMVIIVQTILLALITGLMTFNFWLSYILFLVMISGMLIILMYMTNVASNEKFNHKFNLFWVSILIIMPFTLICKDFTPYMTTIITYMKISMIMTKFFTFPLNMMLIMMLIYLLLMMVLSVNIININSGPLRHKS